MKIHKYKRKTEKEAMVAIKEELGSEALILSIKHIRPKGIVGIFKKPFVEITAAIDEQEKAFSKSASKSSLPSIELDAEKIMKVNSMVTEREATDQEEKDSELDEFKYFIEQFSLKQKQQEVNHQQEAYESKSMVQVLEREPKLQKVDELFQIDVDTDTEDISALRIIYEQLLENDVDEVYANELMQGLVEYIQENNPEIDDVISIIYKRIVKNLSDYETIHLKDAHKVVFFIGPTGVGKTTTIAKIASLYSLNMSKDVALITADTYRIAAVEQLRTYANILSIPIKVVYSKEELMEAVELFKEKDLILIDTAGRSYINEEHQRELSELLSCVDQKDIYLTLSVTTKYRDLINIVNRYKMMTEFKVIFTKLDETTCYGNILNIKKATGSKLSYVTFGQNVPDDISEINPHEIAKNILGGDDDGSSE